MKKVSWLMKLSLQLETLRKTDRPTGENARALALLLLAEEGPGSVGYFFRDDWAEPGWLGPLREAGVFEEFLGPAEAEKSGERWLTVRELADYLCRLAKSEDEGVVEQVVEVLREVGTGDVYATGQFTRAVVKMPPRYAARLVSKLAEWCQPRNPFAREEEIAGLALELARGGYLDEAGQVLELLLKPAPEAEGGFVTGIFFGDDLREFVRGQFAEFAREFPEVALEAAERSLEAALPLRDEKRAEMHLAMSGQRPTRDYSGWRPAIEDHEANGMPHFEDGLVEAVRDALAALVERNEKKAEEVIDRYLRDDSRSIFRRIALHTLAEDHARYPGLAKTAATKRQFFDNEDLYHEYWRLVVAVFDGLPDKQRERIESWILAGEGRNSEEGKGRFILPRLKLLEKCQKLSQEAKDRLKELEQSLGEVDHPEFQFYTRTWVGAFSPASPESLKGKTNDEIVAKLKEWAPTEEGQRPGGASYEGLGRELRSRVTEEPEKRVGLADGIGKTKPVYIWSFLDGLQDAWRAGKTFDWGPALALCDKVVPRTDPKKWPDAHPRQRKPSPLGFHYTWSTVRHAVAMLLHDGLVEVKGREKNIGPEHFEKVRDILVRLVRDPEPTVSWERKRGTTSDWFNVGLNTNRGAAVLALLRYAVGRIVQGEAKGDRLEPEVKEALDGIVEDPCRSVRAILGSELDALWWLDSEWLEPKLGEILPSDGRRKNAWRAAWTSFLQYSRLNPEMHERLKTHYEKTIRLVAKSKENTEKDALLEGLCKHLAALYVWGWEAHPEEVEESLIGEFYRQAGDVAAAALASALERFLRTQRGQEEEKKRVRGYWPRIKDLLEWRIGGIGKKPQEHVQELREYAVWFREIGEEELAGIREMESVLRALSKVPQTGYGMRPLLDYLEKYAKDAPEVAGRVLEGLVTKAERDAWLWEREKIERLVGVLFESGDKEAGKAAVGVVEHLWKEGFWQAFEGYRDHVEAVAAAG